NTRFKCDWSSDVCSSDLVKMRRRRIMGPEPMLGDRGNRVHPEREEAEPGEELHDGKPLHLGRHPNDVFAGLEKPRGMPAAAREATEPELRQPVERRKGREHVQLRAEPEYATQEGARGPAAEPHGTAKQQAP